LPFWESLQERTPEGLLWIILSFSVFGMRFVWEFFKENQGGFVEETMAFKYGAITKHTFGNR